VRCCSATTLGRISGTELLAPRTLRFNTNRGVIEVRADARRAPCTSPAKKPGAAPDVFAAPCEDDGVNFFDRVPRSSREPTPPEPPRPAWFKPDDVLGAGVAAGFVIGRGPDAAIAVTQLTAYPTGFEFTVGIVTRAEDRRGRLSWALHRRPFDDPDEPLTDDFVRLGLQFADGGVATNMHERPFPDLDTEPTGPILMPDGGGGGGRRYDMTYWVWPLPPPGPVTFVCEWPAFGVAESRADLDASLVRDAAARAIRLWD
jgi:hypothetical protein